MNLVLSSLRFTFRGLAVAWSASALAMFAACGVDDRDLHSGPLLADASVNDARTDTVISDAGVVGDISDTSEREGKAADCVDSSCDSRDDAESSTGVPEASFSCPAAMKTCPASSVCVPMIGCCSNADCPANGGGQAGTCDSATHQCDYSCPANTQSCSTGGTLACIPSGSCCKDSDCPGACVSCSSAHSCVPALSQDDPNGRCAGTCNAAGVCKSKRGQLCSTAAAGCIEGSSCAPDGYCCNTACNGSCQACDIAGSVGTCTPVNSGAPHGNHAACGTEPACLGTCAAGACAYSAKTCGTGASCTGNTFVAQSVCSAGACVAPAAQACEGGYTCANNACRLTCSGASGCVATSYCNGTACTPKKPAGQLCGAATECASDLCSGRCCNAGAPCTCPQPSAPNLLQNPGFDQNLSGWEMVKNSTATWTISRSTEDASGCPFSGSISIVTADPNNSDGATFRQCLSVNVSTTYNIGLQWKAASPSLPNPGIACTVQLGNSAMCAPTSDVVSSIIVLSDELPTGWSEVDGSDFGVARSISSQGYTNMLFSCNVRNALVDRLYVSPAPATF